MTVRASRWQERSKGGMAMATSAQQADRLCLSLRLLYNRRMAFDPANPPIWLRKLHVTAAQIDPERLCPDSGRGYLAGMPAFRCPSDHSEGFCRRTLSCLA